MTEKTLTCKHQKEYDKYIAEHNIYTFNAIWDINAATLAKFIKEHHVKAENINEDLEDLLEQFRIH